MSLSRVALGSLVLVGLALYGCGQKPDFVAKPEPWRASEERSCLAGNGPGNSPYITARASLGGPNDACGAIRPFEMSAADRGRVMLRPAATLRCEMLSPVDSWVREVVEPAALRHLGAHLVELKVAASYGCRPMNNISGAKLSEHGHANALDISAFHLADGRSVDVKSGWNGDARQRAFLRDVHDGACNHFTTVLGPLADAHHRDHFHMDLAHHGRDGTYRVCK